MLSWLECLSWWRGCSCRGSQSSWLKGLIVFLTLLQHCNAVSRVLVINQQLSRPQTETALAGTNKLTPISFYLRHNHSLRSRCMCILFQEHTTCHHQPRINKSSETHHACLSVHWLMLQLSPMVGPLIHTIYSLFCEHMLHCLNDFSM